MSISFYVTKKKARSGQLKSQAEIKKQLSFQGFHGETGFQLNTEHLTDVK